MSTWTPTTEQIRYGYSSDPEAEYRDQIGAPAQQREAARAFDRWLAEERRAAAEKAWADGFRAGDGVGAYSNQEIAEVNPYTVKEVAPDGR